MRIKSRITCKLFKLTEINNLDEVRNKILTQTYIDPLAISKQDQDQAKSMSEDEKNFYFTWDKSWSHNEIDFFERQSNGEAKTVSYICAEADIEYPKRRKKDANGHILPKKDRVNLTQVLTFFFNMNKSLYLIICTSNETHVQRVKKLVGMQYISEPDDTYIMPSDLFNWLFYKYTTNQKDLDPSLTLMNISGFIGNIGDEHNIFKGISDQTSELIITKAFISNGETLKTITARIENKDVDIVFTIDEKSNTQIFISKSVKMRILEAERDDYFFIIYLYSQLIPRLKTLYNRSSEQFLDKEKGRFSEKIGLEVIKSIIEKNRINAEELSELFYEEIKS